MIPMLNHSMPACQACSNRPDFAAGAALTSVCLCKCQVQQGLACQAQVACLPQHNLEQGWAPHATGAQPAASAGVTSTPPSLSSSCTGTMPHIDIRYARLAGEHEQEQMQRIVELRGAPPRAMLERAPRREVFFGQSPGPGAGLGEQAADGSGGEAAGRGARAGGRGLAHALRCEDALFLDFMEVRPAPAAPGCRAQRPRSLFAWACICRRCTCPLCAPAHACACLGFQHAGT